MCSVATKTSSATPAPWARWIFRVAVSCETLLAFGQAVLIGGFLDGHYPLLNAHRENATFTAVAALLMTVAAVLQWRPGRGSARPIFACLVVVAAIVVQIIVGYARTLAIHVPLGVAISAGDVWLLVWAWTPASRRAQETGRPPARQGDSAASARTAP
jgi:hypothetical protein